MHDLNRAPHVTQKTSLTRRIHGGHCYIETTHRGRLHVLTKCENGWAVAVSRTKPENGHTLSYRTFATLAEVCAEGLPALSELTPDDLLTCL